MIYNMIEKDTKINELDIEIKKATPYISNFKNSKQIDSTIYTATEPCAVFVTLVTDGTIYQIIKVLINTIPVRIYQNPTNISNLQDSFCVYLQKGDIIEITGGDGGFSVFY